MENSSALVMSQINFSNISDRFGQSPVRGKSVHTRTIAS